MARGRGAPRKVQKVPTSEIRGKVPANLKTRIMGVFPTATQSQVLEAALTTCLENMARFRQKGLEILERDGGTEEEELEGDPEE